ncbi:FMN-binding protein MioC [Acerihabitans arboris]|uniref:FMN-binding protein MioC n=1 Tax=Acerihabitans arboris TaxID=2691583 RepID=A0A845SSC6_9GAMM|nr:FMN-binding protein MioC [Acerihabitans arboris]NDL65588.1 FMN-binding protein MioC [Acerihabitans arboris]
MADITIISGSTLGSAEYVAEHLAGILENQGFTTNVLHGPELEEMTLEGLWLIVSSTHGAGDLPDNLQPLFEQMDADQPSLSKVKFGAIGIGSSEYDTFCGAIDAIDRQMIALGALRIGEILKIDITQHEIPEDPAEEWAKSWIGFI